MQTSATLYIADRPVNSIARTCHSFASYHDVPRQGAFPCLAFVRCTGIHAAIHTHCGVCPVGKAFRAGENGKQQHQHGHRNSFHCHILLSSFGDGSYNKRSRNGSSARVQMNSAEILV